VSGVFISYRRDDCPGHAGRLYDRLAERFGEERVFMDIDAIEPGVDFAERIEQAVGSCDVLIALIGDDWLHASDARGRRRLDDPADFVRLELAAGLQRSGLRVIPVLVQGASMPATDDLPDELEELARRNAFELSDGRWRYDADRLTDVVERVTAPGPPERRHVSSGRLRRPPRSVWVAGVVVAVAGVAAALALLGGGGGGGDGGGQTATGKQVVGPVALGGEAGKLTFGAGSVWVPLGSQQVIARVDPRTLEFQLIPGFGEYPSAASSGDGAIWVADSGEDTVTRVDPRSRELSEPIPVGQEPNDIAVGEGFVWTANCGCTRDAERFDVSRIDPGSREERRIRVQPYPIGIGTGDGNVWVTSDTEGTVQRIDPRAAQVVGDPIKVGDNPTDVAVDGTGIWVALSGENAVVRINPRTLRPDLKIPVGKSPHTLALGDGFLWVAHDGDGTLWRIDTRRGRVVGTPISAGRLASGVAFGDGRGWVADEKSGELRGVAP
jgi:DNA-binding beta-propeller fold protein YncE